MPSPCVAVELVDEEAGAAEQHVGDALHALEGVVDVAGGGEELVLAHMQLLARGRWIGTMWPAPSRLKAIMPGPRGLGHEDLHARDHPLERALHRLEADAHRRVLPQQDVVLEIDRHPALTSTVSTGTSSPSMMVGDAAEGLVVVARGRQQSPEDWAYRLRPSVRRAGRFGISRRGSLAHSADPAPVWLRRGPQPSGAEAAPMAPPAPGPTMAPTFRRRALPAARR